MEQRCSPTVEMESTNFKCTDCGKVFTAKRSLTRHNRGYHKKIRFPCSCDKAFTRPDNLKVHQRNCKKIVGVNSISNQEVVQLPIQEAVNIMVTVAEDHVPQESKNLFVKENNS